MPTVVSYIERASPMCARSATSTRVEPLRFLGYSVTAFSLYENGKTKAPLALIKFRKVLDGRPNVCQRFWSLTG